MIKILNYVTPSFFPLPLHLGLHEYKYGGCFLRRGVAGHSIVRPLSRNAMLVWSLVLSLATVLQVAQAYPKPGHAQYGSLGKHGGVATEVRAYNPHLLSPNLDRSFLNVPRQSRVIGGGMFGDRNRYAYPRWKRGRCCESMDYSTLGV